MIIYQGRHKARKLYRCDQAVTLDDGCKRLIEPGDKYRRVFGAADRGDLPYVVRFCEVCAAVVKFEGEEKAETRKAGSS